MSECLFCKIANREIDTDLVYQDEHVVAFNDINPQAPHHVLIIPRRHINTLNDAADGDAQTLGRLFMAAARIAGDREIAEPGYRVVVNCNALAGQTVFHVHMHLIGGRAMGWPPG